MRAQVHTYLLTYILHTFIHTYIHTYIPTLKELMDLRRECAELREEKEKAGFATKLLDEDAIQRDLECSKLRRELDAAR
jgi:hypothetical protein